MFAVLTPIKIYTYVVELIQEVGGGGINVLIFLAELTPIKRYTNNAVDVSQEVGGGEYLCVNIVSIFHTYKNMYYYC